MICDREEEINAFIPEEYWTLDAKLKVQGSRRSRQQPIIHGDKDGKNGRFTARRKLDAFIEVVWRAVMYRSAQM